MIEIGAVATTTTNLTTRSLEEIEAHSSAPSGRAYESDGADTVETSMSFDDLVDAVNPLQHIPVVSSLYRSLIDDPIHPVSRIAGDILYGGITGIASAGLAAVGAITDEAFAANNDGMSASATVVAAILGEDEPQIPETKPLLALATDKLSTQPYGGVIETSQLPPVIQQAKEAAPKEPAVAQAESPSTVTTEEVAREEKTQTAEVQTATQQTAVQDIFKARRNIHNNRFAVATTTATTTEAPKSTTLEDKATPETRMALQQLLSDLGVAQGIKSYQSAAQTGLQSTSTVNTLN